MPGTFGHCHLLHIHKRFDYLSGQNSLEWSARIDSVKLLMAEHQLREHSQDIALVFGNLTSMLDLKKPFAAFFVPLCLYDLVLEFDILLRSVLFRNSFDVLLNFGRTRVEMGPRWAGINFE
jgi:hypothetical protein